MNLLILVVAALIGMAACQDSYGLPNKLLADVNPGPNSSYPGTWYMVGGKAYTTVTLSNKIFEQILVTDGTTEGTRIVGDINTSQRGNPYDKDPFWTPDDDFPIRFATFDGVLWLAIYNYDTSKRDIWYIDPADDILSKYEGGIVKSVGETDTLYLNIQKAGIFKGEYFAFNPDVVNHGLYFFDKTFSSSYAFNNASNFKIVPDLYDPFNGFDESSSTFLITEDFLIIEGWVQNYGGLWAFDGTTVWPLNLATFEFHSSLKLYDSVNKKLYYIAFFNGLPQLVVNDLNDLTSNFTILTNLDQDCFLGYECFSYLGMMDEQTGTVAFAYNTQLGFTDGTLSGTTFLVGNPRTYSVYGAYKGKLYFSEWAEYVAGSLMVTDGTLAGTRKALENAVRAFIPFNGNVLLSTMLGIYRLDQNEQFTFIRDLALTDVWTTVTLPNNNKQLYTYLKDRRSCGRGCTRNVFNIHVSDGNGIVFFSANLGGTTVIQPVFLNNRFIMSAKSESTGTEVFYMDVAPETYETPPPVPETSPSNPSMTSDAARKIAAYSYLCLLIALFFV